MRRRRSVSLGAVTKRFEVKVRRWFAGRVVVAAMVAFGVGGVGRVCVAQVADAAPLPNAPAASQPVAAGFFARWAAFYREDWKPAPAAGLNAPAAGSGTPTAGITAVAPPAPARRGLPSPLDSPPFPNSDWSYGGSPVIGEQDTNSYPLMTAIDGAKVRTKVYGWVEPTVDFGTSGRSNAPEADDPYPNRFELNQAVLYVERLPDTVQREHVDWGYHLTALYGTDYRYTTGKGYFSNQLLGEDRQYGFDPTLEYVDVYVPRVAQGLNVRVGRFISVPGIEAQLTPYNYMFSHSLLYVIDPFTDTGVMATVKLSDRWLVQLGLTAGHDVALWTPDAQPSGTACVDFTTSSVNDNFYVCANGINSGKVAYNNLQQYDATWYHRISKTVHIATEGYFMYQRDVPAVGGPVAPEKGTNGAYCRTGETRCTAPEWAVQNYANKEISAHDFVSFRSDFLEDKKGQRTGYATKYSENTAMWSHWWGTTVQFRPEARFERAWDRPAYDLGRKQNQFTVASDLIFHF
jgi:Putative beta-barrel porin-2, OmpL-like. bbp2